MKKLFPFVLGLLMVACVPTENKKAVKQIDSLLNVKEELVLSLNSSEIDSFKILYDTVTKYNDFFSQKGLPELSDDELEIIYQYGTIVKGYKKFLNKHRGNLLDALDYRGEKLEGLRHDIEEKLLSEKDFKNYLAIEDSLFNIVSTEVNSRLEYARKHKEMFATYHKKVLALIKNLELEIAKDSI